VEKLIRHGEGWLASHPEKEWITRRYLKHRHSLAEEALARLASDVATEAVADAREAVLESNPDSRLGDEDQTAIDSTGMTADERMSLLTSSTTTVEKEPSLHDQRLAAVLFELKASGAASVLDLGCGEGKLLRLLLKEKQFARIVGLDASHRCLEIATDILRFDRLPPKKRERIALLHGSLMYRDARLAGFDGAALVEVIEHLDPRRQTGCQTGAL
jgi:hypothetical protein